jgi:hypothetical protein
MDLDADVLGDLVARERRTDEPLVRFGPGRADFYTAHKFCTDAWKAANLFRYDGAVRAAGRERRSGARRVGGRHR